MSIIMMALFFLFFIDAKIAERNHFFSDYCSVSGTNALKGIFVMMVFTSHFRTYVTTGPADELALQIVSFLGQLMVAPFLFYSGFGVMESITKKGTPYINRLPVDRALKTLLHFDLAVCLFLLLRLFLKMPVSAKTVLLSLVGWDNLGNSAWYLFAIISLYFITAFSFKLVRNHTFAAVLLTVLTLVLIKLLSGVKELYWYDTMLCYPLGIWYSILRKHVEKIVMHNDLVYCLALTLVFCAFLYLRSRRISILHDNLHSALFVILLVGISMKFHFNNAFLQFLGGYTFEIYILQRIPMIFFSHYGILTGNTVALYLLCFLITCLLALIFRTVVHSLDLLWNKVTTAR